MKINRYKFKTFCLCLFCMLLWGSGYPVLKLSYTYLGIESSNVAGKLLFAGVRFFVAGCIVFTITTIKNRRFIVPKNKDLSQLILLGICQTTLQYGLLYIGLANTSAAKGSVLNQVCIFLSVLLSPIFFKSEKLTVKKIAGCIIGFTGIIIMNLDGLMFILSGGDIFVIMSSCFATFGYLLSKGIHNDFDSLTCTGYQQIFGGIILIIIGLLSGGELTIINTKGIICFLFLVLEAAISFSLWFFLLQRNDLSVISVYKFLTPLISIVLSGVLLHEKVLTFSNIMALILACVGIIIVNSSGFER